MPISYSKNASITKHLWNFDRDNEFETNGSIVNHTFSNEGSFKVTLKVVDNR
ncbi:MAG: PKD domain-containing protein, partial [Halobacteriaceae archaeon]